MSFNEGWKYIKFLSYVEQNIDEIVGIFLFYDIHGGFDIFFV